MNDECRHWLPLLHDWLEGVADEEGAALAQFHLRYCPDCQRVVAEWQAVAERIAEALAVSPPKGFDRKLGQRLCVPAPRLLSWRELTASWLLTTGAVSAAFLWLGLSPLTIVQSLSDWLVWVGAWSAVPAQWLQNLWENLSRLV